MFGYSKTIEFLEKENIWLKAELAKRNNCISDLIDKFVFNKRISEPVKTVSSDEPPEPSPTFSNSEGAQDGYAKAIRQATKRVEQSQNVGEKIND